MSDSETQAIATRLTAEEYAEWQKLQEHSGKNTAELLHDVVKDRLDRLEYEHGYTGKGFSFEQMIRDLPP